MWICLQRCLFLISGLEQWHIYFNFACKQIVLSTMEIYSIVCSLSQSHIRVDKNHGVCPDQWGGASCIVVY